MSARLSLPRVPALALIAPFEVEPAVRAATMASRTAYPAPMFERDVGGTFVRWTAVRAVFHRGWWLVTSLYLVVVADLTASELVFYGATMSAVYLVAEVPTGVLADTVSRKWSLVTAHFVMGAGMVMVGLVTAFPLILVTQVLWGLGWTFSSGADVAWVTDELDDPGRSVDVLITASRWEQVGAAAGMIAFGAIAWRVGLGPSIATAGAGMIALGLFVAAQFPERRFVRARSDRLRASARILRRGVSLARADRVVLVILAATLLVNGGAQAFGFLLTKHLLALGFPTAPDPVVWFTALGLATLAFAALALRIAQSWIARETAARPVYVGACVAGVIGLAIFAFAPDDVPAVAGALLAAGVSWPVIRSVGVIWLNRRVTGEVRATMHSFLSQAEGIGEILGGIVFGIVAHVSDIPATLAGSAAVIALAALLVLRWGVERRDA